MQTGQQGFQQGKLEVAIGAFTKATALAPDKVEGWINLGSALFESRHFDLAATALKKAVAMNPGLMVSRVLLGDALRMLGHWNEAFNNYKIAVDLERTPLSLNKLACAMPSQGLLEFAEGLFEEAIAMDPTFTSARVNLATLQILLNRFEEADVQLTEVAELPLAPLEKQEVESARLALSEHNRLKEAIAELTENHNSAPLEAALRNTPDHLQNVDEKVMETLHRYAESARTLAIEPVAIIAGLPAEWPMIEAMFMLPMVSSVSEYLQIKQQIDPDAEPSLQLRKSLNIVPAIEAARLCQRDMTDPIKAEIHLRHWHALSCRMLPGFLGGHFKYAQNMSAGDQTIRRVEPAFASATFRRFITDIYNELPPGYPRALMLLIALADLHLFGDGNGRTTLTWINRELEWAGLMPAIFSAKLGFLGDLGTAERTVRRNGGDLSPSARTLVQGQRDAIDFCSRLAQARS